MLFFWEGGGRSWPTNVHLSIHLSICYLCTHHLVLQRTERQKVYPFVVVGGESEGGSTVYRPRGQQTPMRGRLTIQRRKRRKPATRSLPYSTTMATGHCPPPPTHPLPPPQIQFVAGRRRCGGRVLLLLRRRLQLGDVERSRQRRREMWDEWESSAAEAASHRTYLGIQSL